MTANRKLAERLAEAWIKRKQADHDRQKITQKLYMNLSEDISALSEGTDAETLRLAEKLIKERNSESGDNTIDVSTGPR